MARVYSDNTMSIGEMPLVRFARGGWGAGKTTVVALPDAGERYLDTVRLEEVGAAE